jgi:dihydropteroate synthase
VASAGTREARLAALPLGRRTLVMGIVNATPDSFSGDGCGEDVDRAVRRGLEHVAAGADLLDVGGESTRPGAEPVPAEVELQRVVPVIRELARRVEVPISVDTYKSEVAEAALEVGASIVNDVWGLGRDPRIADVAARYGAVLVVTHNRAAAARVDALGGLYPEVAYADVVAEVAEGLRRAAARAESRGVPRDRIWVDPGLGFGKTPAQSLELLRRLRELALGYPLLVGPSRKSFLGRVLGLPVGERLEGTAAAVALAVAGGADVVRVHDVQAMVRVVRVADAVVRGWP